jgi:hypothetical protein
MLAEKMQRTDAYQRAMHDWQNKDRLWVSDGQPYPKRADLDEAGA